MQSALQRELKQKRPFRLPEQEAYLSIVRTAAVLEHALAQAVKPFGLTPTQYNVLRILKGAGSAGLCRNAVGERLLKAVPDVTRLLDRMEQSGLIARGRTDNDRRFVRTSITRKGLDLVAEVEAHVMREHRDRLAHVSRRDLAALVDLLARVRGVEQGP